MATTISRRGLGKLIDLTGKRIYGTPNEREPHAHFRPGGLLNKGTGGLLERRMRRGSVLVHGGNSGPQGKADRLHNNPNPPRK